MRDRFTVADLRFLAGDWDAATVDRLLDRSGILEGAPMTCARAADRMFGGYVFDLDGTLYLGDGLLPGAAEHARRDPRRTARASRS